MQLNKTILIPLYFPLLINAQIRTNSGKTFVRSKQMLILLYSMKKEIGSTLSHTSKINNNVFSLNQ